MLLHTQQTMPPYAHICDVKMVNLLRYKEIIRIYWMTLGCRNVILIYQVWSQNQTLFC